MALGRLTFTSISLLALVACLPAPGNDAKQDAATSAQAKPEVVCQHVRELAAQDGNEAEALDAVQRECVQTLAAMQTRYDTFTSCVDAATSPAALRACESELRQPSLLGSRSPSAKVETMCDHIMTLLAAEISQIGGNQDQIGQLRERCITDANASLETIGQAKFDEQLQCIMAATNLQTLQACGNF